MMRRSSFSERRSFGIDSQRCSLAFASCAMVRSSTDRGPTIGAWYPGVKRGGRKAHRTGGPHADRAPPPRRRVAFEHSPGARARPRPFRGRLAVRRGGLQPAARRSGGSADPGARRQRRGCGDRRERDHRRDGADRERDRGRSVRADLPGEGGQAVRPECQRVVGEGDDPGVRAEQGRLGQAAPARRAHGHGARRGCGVGRPAEALRRGPAFRVARPGHLPRRAGLPADGDHRRAVGALREDARRAPQLAVHLPHRRPRSLRRIAEQGRAGYYEGPTAQAIVDIVREQGGAMALSDLAEFQPEWVQPIQTSYRGWTVSEIPPNSQGIAALEMLNILERFPLGEWGFHSTRALHTMIEAKKLAYADLLRYV